MFSAPPSKSFRYAAWLAASYLVLAGCYIIVSGRVAGAIATDVAELEYIEHIKGLLFVLVTATLLFFASWMLFLRFHRAEEARALERRALALVQSKAYAAELAAAVAHDFNNLLMVLHAGVDELAATTETEPGRTTLEEMRQALESARDLTKRMARAARGERGTRRESHELGEIVDDTTRLLRRLPRLRGRDVEVVVTTSARALLDPILVEQILVNLLLNAADAAGEGGRLLIEVTEDGACLCLGVHDDGAGLTDSQLREGLKPFETTKPEGLGLGLLSVRASVEASQGTLCILRSPLGGALFEVRWPKTS